MQTWARRGLQTALVTGGLLMLGTGIASAHENVNPDTPASTLDSGLGTPVGTVSVPVHADNNVIGTPFGPVAVPSVNRTISTSDLAPQSLNKITPAGAQVPALAKPLAQPLAGAGPAGSVVKSVAQTATPTVSKALGQVAPQLPATQDLAPLQGAGDGVFGNHAQVDTVIPVDISGNALAAGGNATPNNNTNKSYENDDPVIAGYTPNELTGNVVEVNWSGPVQITGNAVALLGNATAIGSATDSATTGGDIVSDGSGRSLSGNVGDGQLSTPVQLTGNAVAGGGQAHTNSTATANSTAQGSVHTDGSDGAGSGNVGAIPVAWPVEVNGEALSSAGQASSTTQNTDTATSGTQDLSTPRGDTYVLTNGDPATLSGNVAQPEAANPTLVSCVAGAVGGNSAAQCGNTNTATAGGFGQTSGVASTLAGNMVEPTMAEPTQVFGDSAVVGGNAGSAASNSTSASAPGESYTPGDNSTLSANSANVPVAGSNDVFSTAGSLVGNSSAVASNDVMSTAGGYNGTTGSNSAGSGNDAQVPVAAPAELFGSAGSLGGNADGNTPAESKLVRSGGGVNSNDDNGVVSSNVAEAPTAIPAQVFGAAVGGVANTDAAANSDTDVAAGGHANATGKHGTGAGNVVQVADSVPAQVFGSAANAVGNGSAQASNTTSDVTGGDATADGKGGSVAGNIVNWNDAGPAQVFGHAAAVGANDHANPDNDVVTSAGGGSASNGAGGSVAGNVVTGQLTQAEQVFGDAVDGAGHGVSKSSSDTTNTAGGGVTSDGEYGSLSGNLVSGFLSHNGQGSNSGVSSLGTGVSDAQNQLGEVSGGPTKTSGEGLLDGTDDRVAAPVETVVYKLPVDVLGRSIVRGTDDMNQSVGDEDSAVDVPMLGEQSIPQFGLPTGTDSLMAANEVPALAGVPSLPGLPGLNGLPSLSALDGLTNVQGLSGLNGVQDMMAFPGLPGLNSLPSLPALPGGGFVHPMSTQSASTALPQLPMTEDLPMTGDLPLSGQLPTSAVSVPSVPSLAGVTVPQSLPELPATPGLPTLPVTPQLPSLPTLPSVPGLPASPSLQSAPAGLGSLPELPAVPTLPAMPELPTLPSLADLPALPSLPGLPGLPGVSDLTSGLHGVNVTPGALPTLPSTSGVHLAGLPLPGQS